MLKAFSHNIIKKGVFMDKPFRTFDEQVAILNGTFNSIKYKRMDTDSETKYHLMRNNYYSIINFYNKPFIIERINTEDIYITGVHFNEIKALHDFDRNLRNLFFNVLTQIETSFKTAIAYYFSEHYGIQNKEEYLNPNNYYMGKNFEKRPLVLKTILKLQNYKDNTEKEIIRHYSNKDNIPFWVTIHFLTFGDISKLYSILENKVQDKIVSHFRELYNKEYCIRPNLSRIFIKTFLKACVNFRNVAAHNERIYNYTIKDHITSNEKNSSLSNQRKLFSIYENLKLFLEKTEYDNLTQKLKHFFCNLEDKLNSININIILKEMDFPENWYK